MLRSTVISLLFLMLTSCANWMRWHTGDRVDGLYLFPDRTAAELRSLAGNDDHDEIMRLFCSGRAPKIVGRFNAIVIPPQPNDWERAEDYANRKAKALESARLYFPFQFLGNASVSPEASVADRHEFTIYRNGKEFKPNRVRLLDLWYLTDHFQLRNSWGSAFQEMAKAKFSVRADGSLGIEVTLEMKKFCEEAVTVSSTLAR